MIMSALRGLITLFWNWYRDLTVGLFHGGAARLIKTTS
jgi:hypothetical protein